MARWYLCGSSVVLLGMLMRLGKAFMLPRSTLAASSFSRRGHTHVITTTLHDRFVGLENSQFRLFSSKNEPNDDNAQEIRAATLSLLKQRMRKIESSNSISSSSVTTATKASESPSASLSPLNESNVKISARRQAVARPSSPTFDHSVELSDDATVVDASQAASNLFNGFSKLGLTDSIVAGLAAQNFNEPTAVQKAAIPRLVSGENLLMAASTGSGKTLAFCLPVIQHLLAQEALGFKRQAKRPRCLILVPTRELARQILKEIKNLSHHCKISSTAVLGGEQYSLQKKSLDRLVDIVVASPGRLIQHKEQGNVFLSHVNHVIIDEVDTMLTQGFGSDIRAVLRSVMMRKNNNNNNNNNSGNNNNNNAFKSASSGENLDVKGDMEDSSMQTTSATTPHPRPGNAQIVMATATLTKAVRTLIDDVQGSGFNIEFSDPDNLTPRKKTGEETRISINIIEVDGVHRSLPHIRHLTEETKGLDKLVVLNNVVQQMSAKKYPTLVFCNTVDSCRAVEYALREKGLSTTCYHGDLNSREREANLDAFRKGDFQYMVCTDIAARGLDIPSIDHVIMFDFPLNPVDYIHRAGRCGRRGRKGIVTSLITKRDKILSDAIQGAIARGMPIDNLTSSKKDYQDRTGRLAKVVGRVPRGEAKMKDKREGKREEGRRDGGGSTAGGAGKGRKISTLKGKGGGARSSGPSDSMLGTKTKSRPQFKAKTGASRW